MANFFPNSYRNMLLGSGTRVDLDADTIKVMGVDHADDTPAVGDDFIDDILSAGRVPAIASCPALGSKTVGVVGVGVFDAADSIFSTLSGDQFESLILFKDTGSEPTSDFIVRWDTATGLPFTPNAADATVVWAAGGIITVT